MNNISADLKLIDDVSLNNKIEVNIKDKKTKNVMFDNKRNGYIILGVLVIVGIILILAGAFFQDNSKKIILIILDSIGAFLILLGLMFAFYGPIKNYHLLKKLINESLTDKKLFSIYSIIFYQFNIFKVSNFNIINKIITFTFNEKNIILENNKLYLLDNQNKTLLDINIFSINFNYKINIIDQIKGANFESFSIFLESEIKKHITKILNYLQPYL